MQNWISILKGFEEKNIPVALATVTKCLGSTPCKLGAKMIVTLDKRIYGTIGGGRLEFNVIDKAIVVINKNKIVEYSFTLGPETEQCCGGKVELIIEPMNQSPELYIFGAGHIGVELCNILKDTPFKINLLDTRKGWKDSVNISDNISYSDIDFDLYKQYVKWGSNCYVLIMTHDHKLDFEIMALALHSVTNYIGLIGSKTKKVRFNNMLKKELNFELGISPVHCPVGLDIGGVTPNEIAISVAAELLQVYYKKLK
ncbi:MAG: xanthine dehydrogenase accessory protein XdhC [Urechidicola sp.]|nr:xanthine dehydrogenase accessory protein XdhC [Urechidicola sp.]